MPTVDPLIPITTFGRAFAVPGWPSVPPASSIFGRSPRDLALNPARLTPVNEAQELWLSVPTTGTIAGVVTEGGIPVPNACVFLYFRKSGEKIGGTRAGADGSFIFYGLDPTSPADPDDGKYFVVALDPAGGTRYNALIYDRVVPS